MEHFYYSPAEATVAAAGGGVGNTLTADNVAFSVSGTAAGLAHGYKIAAASGAFALTGPAATLSTTSSPPLAAAQSVYGGRPRADDDWHHFERKWKDEEDDAERKALAKARAAIEAARVETLPTVKTAPAPVRKAFAAPTFEPDFEAYLDAIDEQIERVRSARVMADRAYKAAATKYIAAMEAEARRLEAAQAAAEAKRQQELQEDLEEEETIMSLLLDD